MTAPLLCYDRPLSISKPMYAGLRTLESRLVEADPLAQRLLAYLLETLDPPSEPHTLGLARLATAIGASSDRRTRLHLYAALEELARWRVTQDLPSGKRCGPPLVLHDATVVIDMHGHMLTDVTQVRVALGSWFAPVEQQLVAPVGVIS